MEESSSNKSKKIIGLVLVFISIIGIVISSIVPVLFSIILFIFCILLVFGVINLAKGVLEEKKENIYWLIFSLTAILPIIALFTPALHSISFFEYDSNRDFAWLWDLPQVYDFEIGHFEPDYYTLVIFSVILFLIAAISVVGISTKVYADITKFGQYEVYFKIMSNIFIFPPIAIYGILILPLGPITPGFAIIGPIFAGILLKVEYKHLQLTLNTQLDEFHNLRNELGFLPTINGANAMFFFSAFAYVFRDALRARMSNESAASLLDTLQIVFIIITILAYLSIFLTLFKAYGGMVLLIITGVLTLIVTTYLLFVTIGRWERIFAILMYLVFILIIGNLRKVRKLARLERKK